MCVLGVYMDMFSLFYLNPSDIKIIALYCEQKLLVNHPQNRDLGVL